MDRSEFARQVEIGRVEQVIGAPDSFVHDQVICSGAEFPPRFRVGMPALFAACGRRPSPETDKMIRWLLNDRHCSAVYEPENYTILHALALRGNTSISAALPEEIFSTLVNAQTGVLGITALYLASSLGHVEMVRLLLAKGASPLIADRDGVSPAMAMIRHAAVSGTSDAWRPRLEILHLLGPLLPADNLGNTILHELARRPSQSVDTVVWEKFSTCSELNVMNKRGLMPLHVAALNCQFSAIQHLVHVSPVDVFRRSPRQRLAHHLLFASSRHRQIANSDRERCAELMLLAQGAHIGCHIIDINMNCTMTMTMLQRSIDLKLNDRVVDLIVDGGGDWKKQCTHHNPTMARLKTRKQNLLKY